MVSSVAPFNENSSIASDRLYFVISRSKIYYYAMEAYCQRARG